MKKISIVFLACFFAVNTMTASAQMISPEDQPSIIAAPTMDFYSTFMIDYDPALAWAFENDVLKGDDVTGALRETDCVKRAEMIKMLYNVLQISTANAQAELFSDTPADQWYADYVRKARERNTIKGYEDGTFKPGQCVNRGEALKMALLEFPNINPVGTPTSDYMDVNPDQWFYAYVSYALANDLVGLRHTSYTKKYYPAESMTRDEVAEMLYRLKTLQDNGLAVYDTAYGPENVVQMPLTDYNLDLEEYFAYDTSMLMVLDTQNTQLIGYLNGFLAGSPAEDVNGLVEELFAELSTDLASAFDDGFKMMLGMGSNNFFRPESTLLITVEDSAKLNSAIDKMAALSGYTKSRLFGFNTLTNPMEEVYFAYTDDELLAWPTPAARYLALQKIKNGEKNLSENASYVEYTDTIPTPNVGMMYFSSPMGESGVFALVPSLSGLNLHYRIDGYGTGGNETPYMYKKLPGKDLMAYGENYGMLDILAEQENDFAVELQTEGVISSDGAWMNQGYAFAMHDTASLIPGMAMYFDASGHVSQAEADLDNIDAMMDEMMAEAPPEFADIIVKDTVRVDGKYLNRITVNMDQLPEEELTQLGPFADFFTAPLEFYYGVTSDDYVVFALYTGFDDVYGSAANISANADIQEGMDFLTGYPDGLSYMSLASFVGYIDMLVTELEESAEPMPAESREKYEEFLDYLAPIKYIIGAEKDFGDIAGGLMFVKID